MARAFESCFKYTDLAGSPIQRSNIYQRDRTSGPDRIAFGPAETCKSLVRQLVANLQSPVFVLLVLSTSRRGRELGRYQSDLLSIEDVDRFLAEFGEFLDRDARQELWVGTPDGASLVVWDAHQIIYAYGDMARFEATARENRLSPGLVGIAAPHTHHYHALFDDTEEEILDRFDWHWSALRESDG